jgi:hypothetical protein
MVVWHPGPANEINSRRTPKDQRMSEVVIDNHGTCGSGSRLNRAGNLLFILGLVNLLCCLFATQNCAAQAADQSGNQAPTLRQPHFAGTQNTAPDGTQPLLQ